MCKPACCPGNNNGSGLGVPLAALIGFAVIAAIARPVIRAVEDILHIVLMAVSALAGLAILTVTAIVIMRLRRAWRTAARPAAGPPAHGWHAQVIKPGTWSYRDPRFTYRKFELTQPSTGCEFC